MTAKLASGRLPAEVHFGHVPVGSHAGFEVEILEQIFGFEFHKIRSVYVGTFLEKTR